MGRARILNSKCDYEGWVVVDETENVLWAKYEGSGMSLLTKDSCKKCYDQVHLKAKFSNHSLG